MTEELIQKVVDEISFGFISPKDLRKQSVVEIQTPDRAILRFAKTVLARANINFLNNLNLVKGILLVTLIWRVSGHTLRRNEETTKRDF